jgi:hypothetical protein
MASRPRIEEGRGLRSVSAEILVPCPSVLSWDQTHRFRSEIQFSFGDRWSHLNTGLPVRLGPAGFKKSVPRLP